MTREKKNLFHQRKKGLPITYDGSNEPIPLAYVSQKWPDKLTLKINASTQDWNTLHHLAMTSPEYLGRLIFLHITRPVYDNFLLKEKRNLPRGFHNEAEQIFMEEARMYVAAAYAVLSYWAKHPFTAWPDYLQAIIREAEKLWTEEIIWPPIKQHQQYLKNERQSVDVTAGVKYLLMLKHGRRGDELGLGNVELMDNEVFSKIYMDKKKVEAAVALRDDFMQKYGDSLTIDVLYEFVPKFGWEYERLI